MSKTGNHDKPPYQPWYEAEFWTRRVRCLVRIERLMYRSLLQEGWALKTPGRIPNDQQTLMDLADCPDEKTWDEHGENVMAMFELSEDGKFFSNDRQLEEYAKWEAKQAFYRRRAEAGAQALWSTYRLQKNKQKPAKSKNASSMPKHNGSSSIKHASQNASSIEKQNTQSGPAHSTGDSQVIVEPLVIITLPLNDGSEHLVTQPEVDEWAKLYPVANVAQELRNMKGWLLGNSTRRKTKNGINRFIQAWLAKVQNNGHPSNPAELGLANAAGGNRHGRRTEVDSAETDRAAEAAVEKFQRGKNALGTPHVPAGVAAKRGDPS